MNIEKMIDTAFDLKIATLKASEQGIISYTQNADKSDSFQIYSGKDFKEMLKTREYKIKRFDHPPYKYQYEIVVLGMNFMHIVTQYLFIGDKAKLEREEENNE